jgi:hypothetical protein
MRNLTTKELIFIGFYYFCPLFLAFCVFYDTVYGEFTGFTAGYIFAFFYFIARLLEVSQHVGENDEHGQ